MFLGRNFWVETKRPLPNSYYIEKKKVFILNTIQIIVFSRSRFQKTNIGFLSSLLAFIDFIGLFWSFVIYKYLPLINLNLALVSSFTCFTFKWISRIFQQMPLYTQAFITLVNFLKVKHPRRFVFLNKNLNIIYIITIIFICEGIVNIPNMFQYITYKNNTAYLCSTTNTQAIMANFTTSMLRSIIPILIMIILDFLIIKTLFVSKKKISNNLSKQKAFAIVLLILDIIFFIFNVPLSCTEIITVVYQDVLLYPSNDNTMALINVFHAFANTFAYMYYLAPFFINLFFNRLFRQELFAYKKTSENNFNRINRKTINIKDNYMNNNNNNNNETLL